MTKKQRKKQSERMKKRWSVPGAWQKVFGNRSKNKSWAESRHRSAVIAAEALHKNHKGSYEEGQVKHSETSKEMYKDPEYKAYRIKQVKKAFKDPKVQAIVKEAHNTKEYKEMQSRNLTARWKDPAYRNMMLEFLTTEHSEFMKELWTDPEYLIKQWEGSQRNRKEKSKAQSKRLRDDYASGKRKPAEGSGYKFCKRGWISTAKGGRIYYRSGWELFFILLLDSSSMVLKFKNQPFRVPYKYHGHMHTYLPDFLITLVNGDKWLLEIKGQMRKQDKVKCKAGKKYAKKKGYNWLVIQERSIESIEGIIQ